MVFEDLELMWSVHCNLTKIFSSIKTYLLFLCIRFSAQTRGYKKITNWISYFFIKMCIKFVLFKDPIEMQLNKILLLLFSDLSLNVNSKYLSCLQILCKLLNLFTALLSVYS